MSFKNTMRIVYNAEEYGNDLDSAAELPIDDPTVLDQIEAQEDEVALVEAENEIEDDINGMEEGEELAETADEEVADAEEVLAEADAKAAETGEEAVIPVEDVVASQEALKSLIKLSGETIDNVSFGNREALYNDSRATYAQNLEGLKEIGNKIKEGLKKIWDKIVAAFNWIVKQIKKVLPTKLNRLKWLVENLRTLSVGTTDSAKLAEAQKAFVEKYKEKFAAVTAITNVDLTNVSEYAKSILSEIQAAKNLVGVATATKEGASFYKTAISVDKTDSKALISKISSLSSADIDKDVAEQTTGLTVKSKMVVGVSGKGTTLKALVRVVVNGEEGEEVRYVTSTKTVPVITAVTFNKEKAITGISGVLSSAAQISSNSDALNTAIAKYRDVIAENEKKNMFANWKAGRDAEKAIRKYITHTMAITTGFDSGVLNYALAYGKATLSALKGSKKEQ